MAAKEDAMPLSKEEIEAFLRQPNVAVVATVGPDGEPHAVLIWYEYGDGQIIMHTGPNSRKHRNLRRNDRVSICVDTKTVPYRAVVVYGRASLEEGVDEERLRRMAVAYLGEALGKAYADAFGGQPTVIVRVRPERIVSWDYSRGDRP
jgi:PPOX class probable F420-dependent enzyme